MKLQRKKERKNSISNAVKTCTLSLVILTALFLMLYDRQLILTCQLQNKLLLKKSQNQSSQHQIPYEGEAFEQKAVNQESSADNVALEVEKNWVDHVDQLKSQSTLVSRNQNSNDLMDLTKQTLEDKFQQTIHNINATITANNDVRYVHYQLLYNTPFFQSEQICVKDQCCARSYLVPKRIEDFTPLANFSPRELAEIRIQGVKPPEYIQFPSPLFSDQFLACFQPGIVIQIDGNIVDKFFEKYNEKINVPYVLISGDSAESPKINENIKKILNSEKLIHWFAHHVEFQNEKNSKFTPMPIGISQWRPHRPVIQQILAQNQFQNPFKSQVTKVTKNLFTAENCSYHFQ